MSYITELARTLTHIIQLLLRIAQPALQHIHLLRHHPSLVALLHISLLYLLPEQLCPGCLRIDLLIDFICFFLGSDDRRAAACLTAGHGTTGVHNLTVQGNNLKPVLVLFCHSNCAVHILHNDRAAQEACLKNGGRVDFIKMSEALFSWCKKQR